MAGKRVRISMKEYNELIEAHGWCAQNGLTGLQQFYGQLLDEHEWRGSLPREISDRHEQERQAAEDKERS